MEINNNGVRSKEDNHIQVKIPNYFPNPINWFTQVDAAFEISNIRNSKTKYFHLLTSLPPDILEMVSYELNPHASEPYENLKQAILSKTSMSVTQAIDRLINSKMDSYKRPSQILAELTQCFKIMQPGENPETSNLLRHRFMQSVSINIRHHLVQYQTKSLDEIAKLADYHHEIESQSINSMIKNSVENPNSLQEITPEDLNAIKARRNHNNDNIVRTWCFYHRKFGKYALKCQQPCSWSKNSHSGKANGSQ